MMNKNDKIYRTLIMDGITNSSKENMSFKIFFPFIGANFINI